MTAAPSTDCTFGGIALDELERRVEEDATLAAPWPSLILELVDEVRALNQDLVESERRCKDQAEELNEVNRELDRYGVPPAQAAPARVRAWQTSKVSAPSASSVVPAAPSGAKVVWAKAFLEDSAAPHRRRLPDLRIGKTHHFVIHTVVGGEPVDLDGYLTTGVYEDGRLGEFFIRTGLEHGSTIRGFADAWATACSILLQYGAPLEVITGKFFHWSFEPAGRTECADLLSCSSIVDYVARWLDLHYGAGRGQ